ncbi:MAG TPA: phage terminase large subunit [Nitrospira sp.]|nr:phage terminase large subunit [Nitrospira sp.]
MTDQTTNTMAENVSPQAALRALLATDFASFIRYTFGVLRPGVEFRPNWHIDAMAYKLSQIASGEVKKLIITVPPRNLKSICASVALPAWFLGHHPSERVVAVSYSSELAKTHASDFRRVVTDPLYQAIFPGMRIQRETDKEIATTARGRRYATSIEGTLTGLGGNLIVIDDPIKLGDASSEVVRKRSIDWYRNTLVTRPDDKKAARIVVVMQRVHQEDLVGYLQEQGGFDILNLPAIAQTSSTFSTGSRSSHMRLAGEILHPEHESGEILLGIKRDMGSMQFSAQYQQTPVPAGGTFIKRTWLKTYPASEISPQHRDRMVISWDIALSEAQTGDSSAGVVLLCRGDTFYVLEVCKGQFPFGTLIEKILDMVKRYHPNSSLVIEESPISLGLIQALKQNHINVVAITPTKDKRSRVISQTDRFEGGSVLLPERAEWLDGFIGELLSFPGGRHDDQVDALVQGMAWMRAQWMPPVKSRIVLNW